ncbi:MAG: V-type ATPase subunit [Actinomycetota bacterium]
MQPISYEITDDDYYLFTVGELSARESELIEDARLKRMAAALNVKELFKLLRETYYSRYSEELESGESFDKVVSAELRQMASHLLSRLKESHRPVLDVLFIPEQIHNYKAAAKALAKSQNLEKLFMPLLYTYHDTVASARGTKFEHMDIFSRKMAVKAAQLFKEGNAYREAEFKLEKFYLDSLWEELSRISARMIIDFFRCSIDMYNIKNVYRHWLASEETDIQKIIIPHGFLEKDFYKNLKKEGTAEFFKSVEKTAYHPLVSKGGQLITEHNDYAVAEKNEDIFYRIFFDPVKYTTFNLEKVFDFFLRKKIELKTLNIIYSGILYGMDKDRLRHEVLILDEDKNRSNW